MCPECCGKCSSEDKRKASSLFGDLQYIDFRFAILPFKQDTNAGRSISYHKNHNNYIGIVDQTEGLVRILDTCVILLIIFGDDFKMFPGGEVKFYFQ
jgi:hypothetical protein